MPQKYFLKMNNIDTTYSYTSGKIRAFETSLLDGMHLKKMISAGNFQAATTLLDSKLYNISEFTYSGFDAALEKHFIAMLREIGSFVPNPEFVTAHLLKYDFFNLRQIADNFPEKEKMIPGGFEIKSLAAMLKKSSFKEFSKISSDIPDKLAKIFSEREKTDISTPLGQLYFDTVIKILKSLGSEISVNYFRLKIDLLNLGNFYRCSNMKKGTELFSNCFIYGGNAVKEFFIKAFSNESVIRNSSFEKNPGIHDETFEKKVDDMLTDFISVGKIITFGIEPVIGFIRAKEIEIKNIRLILYGKLYAIENEKIISEMRNPYVQ
ncbi:MAG: V-type sodium ATPase subunit C [Elusimicrobia bacterium ADurb.Bin231]|nr:MAG: V-type sodium ATPase subunit C [Elusimicrobia bacterium ADurb.Bin231]